MGCNPSSMPKLEHWFAKPPLYLGHSAAMAIIKDKSQHFDADLSGISHSICFTNVGLNKNKPGSFTLDIILLAEHRTREAIAKSWADSRLALSQWETSLQNNAVCHWQGANLESDLKVSTHFMTIIAKEPMQMGFYHNTTITIAYHKHYHVRWKCR